ncbi:MAG TPA: DUF1761 domain-containing protein [Longimicrobiaceae bacterium]|nr:DUF1761 domain-containing protein [Longimicrobiaceae bacterium]
MDMSAAVGAINWLAVVVASVSTFVLGALWYGPLFGKTWMRASGMSEEQMAQGGAGMIFGLSFVLQLVAAVVLAMFIGANSTIGFGLFAGGSVGLFWVAAALGVVYLFERRPLAHWAVNAGYHVVSFLVMGAILGAWS